MTRAWVLNLDVEREFEARASYQVSKRAREAAARVLPKLAGNLLRPGDLVLEAGMRAEGWLGCAWSPTSRALEQLAAAGASLPASPGDAVLARVNAREFLLPVERGLGLDFGKRALGDLEQLRALIGAEGQRACLVRRRFGAAGRGSRRFGGRGKSLEAEDPGLTWLRAAFGQGGMLAEPFVEVLLEVTCHGWVARSGECMPLGVPCVQEVGSQGAWRSTRRAALGELQASEVDALLGATAAMGGALAAAGYFGPFGVDGFRYRAESQAAQLFQPLGEVNARFSMDWVIGMGSSALDLQLLDR